MIPRRRLLLALPALWLAAASPVQADASTELYEKIRARGVLTAAVYRGYAPYSWEQDGKVLGIDADIATALAKALGLGISLRAVPYGEDLDEDLRNFVWKGTIVGGDVSDVMLHVGADPEYVRRQRQVSIFSPYYRETVGMAVDPRKLPADVAIDKLKGRKVAVELGSIADLYLSDARNGLLRTTMTRYPTAEAAVAAFVAGEAEVVIAGRGEIQGIGKLRGGQVPATRSIELGGMFRGAWDVGLAVKTDNQKLRDELAAALAQLEKSGELATIFARYGVDRTPPESLPSPGMAGAP